MQALFRIDPRDMVATALRDLKSGEIFHIGGAPVILTQDVARGHKVALRDIASGEPVIKYGFPFGQATMAIAAGSHVHVHNVKTMLAAEGQYRRGAALQVPTVASGISPSFQGYRRTNGRVATRNEIWVIPTVGCVANAARKIADKVAARHAGRIDGALALTHPFGCSQLGDDLSGTRQLLAALANHPNAAGVLLLGLGCESNQLAALLDAIDPAARSRIAVLGAQLSVDEIEEGVALLDPLAEAAGEARRSEAHLGELVLGLKCGGSDGFSGLTANPLVGRMADAVTGAGGTAILTEIPEIFGGEQLLLDRAADDMVFDATVALVNGFKRYFTDHGEPVSENPSPGNIAGGITTLEEKSLGAVQKAGHAPLTDVIPYGARATKPGLTLLEAPGNDAVSCTALTAAGSTMILFTTGRGTPLGFPTPTVKIASNSALARRKPGWIDFDAGQVMEQGLDAARDALVDRICAIASGEPTAAERNGEREIAIWKRGVTL